MTTVQCKNLQTDVFTTTALYACTLRATKLYAYLQILMTHRHTHEFEAVEKYLQGGRRGFC